MDQNLDTTRSRLVPWLVVGVIAVFALIASLLFLNLSDQFTDSVADNTDTQASEFSEASDKKADENTNATEQAATDSAQEKTDPPIKAPSATVGQTVDLVITQWDKKLPISTKFGATWYQLRAGGEQAQLNSALIDSLPDSCAALKTEFGFRRVGERVEVMKPASSCPAAEAIYNEIWGLLHYAAQNAKG